MMGIGKVYLVGAGPGDSELITVKGVEAIKKADVILYDRLVNPRLLEYAKANCELIYCGKLPTRHFMKQDEINQTLLEKALAGFTVVRLKGGDPSVFGRVGEEAEVLADYNVNFEIVPGITSGIAAPLYAGIPVTHRDYAGSFAMVTAHDKSKNGKPDIDWEGLARGVQTIAFYMGISNLEHICDNLILNGKSPNTPVIVIRWGTWSRQQSVEGTLSSIVQKVRDENIENPAITLVGDIVATREKTKWFEKKPLFGQQILLARGSADEKSMAVDLIDKGADVIEFPKWEIKEKTLDRAVKQKVTSYRKILFKTTEAVTHFFNLLIKNKIDIRHLQAKLYCLQPSSIIAIENKGLIAQSADNMVTDGSLLIIGGKIKNEQRWKLDYKYGVHDYASVYETSIDERFDMVIKRSIDDAAITTILLPSSDAVHMYMKKAEHYELSSHQNDPSISVICLNKQAFQTATMYGLKPTLMVENINPFTQASVNVMAKTQ
jgi:uroporphyrinogen III methyltransferase/synthase